MRRHGDVGLFAAGRVMIDSFRLKQGHVLALISYSQTSGRYTTERPRTRPPPAHSTVLPVETFLLSSIHCCGNLRERNFNEGKRETLKDTRPPLTSNAWDVSFPALWGFNWQPPYRGLLNGPRRAGSDPGKEQKKTIKESLLGMKLHVKRSQTQWLLNMWSKSPWYFSVWSTHFLPWTLDSKSTLKHARIGSKHPDSCACFFKLS